MSAVIVSVLTAAALSILLVGVLLMFMVWNRKTCARGISLLWVLGTPVVALRAYVLGDWVSLFLYLVIVVLGAILASMLMAKFNESRFSKYRM